MEAFRSLHTSACCPYLGDTFAFAAGIEDTEQQMDLVPTAVAEGIDLAYAGPCRNLVGAFAALVVDDSLAAGLRHPAARERQQKIARHVRHFSYSRRPLLAERYRLRNQTSMMSERCPACDLTFGPSIHCSSKSNWQSIFTARSILLAIHGQ